MSGFDPPNHQSVYFDNAASTPLRKEVREHMAEMLSGPFANPSSTHQFGRKSKSVVEEARKFIAKALNCSSGEIIFTSGGTEGDNAALLLPVRDLGIARIITSPMEHHAVLHAAEALQRHQDVELQFVNLHENGAVDMAHLEGLLQGETPTLVSLMHGNNEVGNLLDLRATAELCHRHGALFHSDTVQTVGHFPIDLAEVPVDFITASAHKFYGPKGVGFLFMRSSVKAGAFITGGAQERNMRGGTENILGIAGLHQALKSSLENLAEERSHIEGLKSYFIETIKAHFPEAVFNGQSADLQNSLYTVVSVGFPKLTNDSMFLFSLDLKGIAVSGGSACASGSLKGSHVISQLYPEGEFPVLRFSFGKDNTREEVDYAISVLREVVKK